MLCFKCHNVAALHHLMVEIWELLSKHQYFGSFLIKIGKFDPPGYTPMWSIGTFNGFIAFFWMSNNSVGDVSKNNSWNMNYTFIKPSSTSNFACMGSCKNLNFSIESEGRQNADHRVNWDGSTWDHLTPELRFPRGPSRTRTAVCGEKPWENHNVRASRQPVKVLTRPHFK